MINEKTKKDLKQQIEQLKIVMKSHNEDIQQIKTIHFEDKQTSNRIKNEQINLISNRVNDLNKTLNKDYIKKPCSNNPCLNGGICNDNGTSYICSCSNEYWGSNCESKI